MEKQNLLFTVEMDVNSNYFVYLKYKYCNKPYFHFWFQGGMKTLFVNKEKELFFFKTCLPVVFF